LHEDHEMIPLIINSLRQDLESRSEVNVSLALAAVCNIGGKSMAESLTPVVQRLLVSAASSPMIKKKAAMCMLRLQQKFPAIVSPDEWRNQLNEMISEPDLGIMTAYMSFLNALAKSSPEPYAFLYAKVVGCMSKIVVGKRFTRDYIYYRVPCPWLQVKCLKFLQHYPAPQDPQLLGQLHDILSRIIASADSVKGQKDNSKNAYNAVLFECVSLVIHLNTDVSLLRETASLLGKLLADRGSNLRYLGLELMNKLAVVLNSQESGQSNKSGMNFQEYQETVTMALQDPDISIRRRALDLLYGMCSRKTSRSIVLELLGYLQSLNINLSADIAIREELVLKIAILAEKYAPSNKWYVDVMLKLITIAGDVMSDEIWFRVIKIVTNHPEIQEYATRTMFQAMGSPQCNETTVRIAGYLLGEYGNLVANDPMMSPEQQTQLTLSKLATSTEGTRAMLLSTFIKFVNLYPEVTQRILPIFRAHAQYLNAEIQQRAVEYFNLVTLGDDKLLETVCDVMPAFGEITDEVEDEDVSQDNVPIANLLEQTKLRQEQYQLQYMNDEASDDDEGLNRGDDEDELSARNYGAAGALANSMYPGNPLYSQQQQGGLNLNNLSAEERQMLMQLIQMQQQGVALTPQQQQLLQQLMMKASMQTQYASPTSTVSSSSSPVNSPYNSQQGAAAPQVTQALAGLTLEQTAQLQQLLALQQQLQAQGQQLPPMQQQLLQQMINVHMTAKQLQSGVSTSGAAPLNVPAAPPMPLTGGTTPLAGNATLSGTQPSTSPSTGAAPTMIIGMNKPVFGGGTYDITREFEGVIRLAKGDPTELQRQQAVQEEKRKANFRRLCLRNEGVLYEDTVVQIGFKSEYQQGQGRLALFFGNKTQQALSNFTASAASTPQLTVAVTQKEAPVIEPMSQNKLFLTLTCLAPFTESSYPLLNVNFVSQGRPMSIKHELPVNIAKFVDPVPLDGNGFFQQWKQTGTGQEVQEVFKAALAVNVPNISKLLSIGLRLAVLSDVDTNVNNIVCSGQCYTQLGPVPCLVRLETNPTANMIRMTVKSNNTQLAEAVKQLLMAHLAVSPAV
jgi:hypothetical protein